MKCIDECVTCRYIVHTVASITSMLVADGFTFLRQDLRMLN